MKKVITLTADAAVPLADEVSHVDLKERVAAQAKTLDLLCDAGYDLEITQEDIDAANALAASYAQDPQTTSKETNHLRASKLPTGAVALTKAILDQFGKAVVESSTHIRHMVVNKLIIETENPDARVRIRALELLGKMSDVALFTERSEVTVTHQSSSELKSKLREKLEKLKEKSVSTKKDSDGVYVPVLDPDADVAELFEDAV